MEKTVYLLRHCKSAGKELHAELTEEGEVQANELVSFFEKSAIKRIISSPLKRSIQSVKPTADTLGLQVEIDERLADHKLMSASIKDWLERLEESIQDKEIKMVGGDSINEVAKSCMEVLNEATEGTVLATHRNTIGLILLQIDGIIALKDWSRLSQPDIYEVKINKTSFSVRRLWDN